MKARVYYLLLAVFICCSQALPASNDQKPKGEKFKSFYMKVLHGKKGVDRYKTWEKYYAYNQMRQYREMVDYMSSRIPEYENAEGKYRLGSLGSIYLYRGYAYYFLQQFDSALHDLRVASELIPKSSYVYYVKGLVKQSQSYLLMTNDPLAARSYLLEARENLDRAIDLKKKEKHYYATRGDIITNLDGPIAAMDDFEKCIRIDKKWPEAYYRKAVAEYSVDRAMAIKDLHKSIEVDPGYLPGYMFLSNHYFEEGKSDSAIVILHQATKYSPANFQLYQNLGWLYLEMGDNASAIENFSKSLLIYMEDFHCHLGIAIAYFDSGDKEKSKLHMNLAKSIHPALNKGMEGIREIEQHCYSYSEKEKRSLEKMFAEMD